MAGSSPHRTECTALYTVKNKNSSPSRHDRPRVDDELIGSLFIPVELRLVKTFDTPPFMCAPSDGDNK